MLAGTHIAVTALAMAAFIGVILGLRFKVFILAPAIVIGAAIVSVIGAMTASNFWSISLAALSIITALQVGYFAGAVIIRFFAKRGVQRQRSIRKQCGGMKSSKHPAQA